MSAAKQIYYSDKYTDDEYEYRHVMLPKEIAKLVPKTHLMSEAEWRSIGVQQSQGWIHYMRHDPEMGEISSSQEYQSFRSTVPQKRVIVDDDNSKEWTMYDAGPKTVRCPLICFPPASGTADVFFRQILGLTAAGYRVIAVEYPVYWTMKEFVDGFRKLLDHLQLDRVHIFGGSLGGFLAQKFAECSARSPRVASMLDGLTQQELASRLTLNCMNCYVEPQKLRDVDITIMDVFDDCALSGSVKDEMYKCYPEARRAHLKSGGNFPYLSRSADVNVMLQASGTY
ncbi:hypothetical protein C0Q70_20612 [Pomacea canaliculata]|uniref:Cyclin-dependent kinases regulatory subunit n=1 Tax=Pomacea canaliculata TaxID=400727 RepID=A0A2T7NG26_POMCA|nr:hypothetical protein C0Q70_20612 [Pomacea canaliculata]